MKTPQILNRKAPQKLVSLLVSAIPAKRLLATAVGIVFAVFTTVGAGAQTATTKPVGFLKAAEMATELLTAPLTTAQRRVLHAENFNSLSLASRPVYLYVVAYGVGYVVSSNGQCPASTMTNVLISSIASSGEDLAPVTLEESQAMAPFLSAVNLELKSLNLLIAGQIVNSPDLHQAMFGGAVDSFLDLWDLSC